MKEIPAEEIMRHWNNYHSEKPCTLQEVNEYLDTHIFFNLSPITLVEIMEKDFMV